MNRDAIVSHISSHTLLNVLANFFRVIISGIVLIYVARQLGPSQYGIVSLGLSVAALAGIFFDFGLTTSTARFLAETPDSSSLVYHNGRFLNVTFSLLFCLVLLILSKPIAVLVNIGSPVYIQIICFVTFFTSLFRFSNRSLQGIKKTDKVALLNFLQSIITNILIFAIAFLGYKAYGVLIGHSTSWVIIWLISVIVLQKYFKFFNVHINTKMLKKIFFYALPLLVTSSSYFLLLRGPTVLLSAFTSTKEVSFLNIPMRIVELVTLPAYSLSVVSSPFFTKKGKSEGNLPWLYVRIFKYLLIFYLPLSIFMALISNRLIHIVLGVEYAKAASVLLILSFYMPFFAITNFSGATLDFLGFAKQKSIIFAITTICSIALAFYFIPLLKEIGAALVIAIPYTLFSLYTILVSSRKSGVILRSYIIKCVKFFLITIISCLPPVITLYFLKGFESLLLSFGLFTLTYFSLAKITSSFEIKEIIDLIKSMR